MICSPSDSLLLSVYVYIYTLLFPYIKAFLRKKDLMPTFNVKQQQDIEHFN